MLALSLQQQVEVRADTVQVETSSTQLGQVIDDKQMLKLSLNGRSYIDLLSIPAGVAPQSSSTGNILVNGQRGSSNSFLVNSAFEFLRNSDLDSRSFFNTSVAVLKRNQFGYAAGGPPIKNKLFWFTDYHGTRQSQGSSSSLTVLPNVARRGGTLDPNDLETEVMMVELDQLPPA